MSQLHRMSDANLSVFYEDLLQGNFFYGTAHDAESGGDEINSGKSCAQKRKYGEMRGKIESGEREKSEEKPANVE